MTTDVQPKKPHVPARHVTTTPAASFSQSDPPNSSRSAHWWKRGILAVLAVVIAIAIVAPFMTTALSPAESRPKLTHTIKRSDLSVTVTADGTLESSNNQEIKCKVKGGSTVLWVIENGTEVNPGDELIRLDASSIEDDISQKQISYETALAAKVISESDVAVAKTNITEYLESTYEEARNTIENEIFVAEQGLKQAQLSYESTKRLVARGLITSLQLEGDQFAVDSARKVLELAKRRLHALEKFTKEKNVQELEGALKAAEAKLASDTAALDLETVRWERAKKQLENCVIQATSSGLVIYPVAEQWREVPAMEEGAAVREQQTLLIIPDLTTMQVKVGIHESKCRTARRKYRRRGLLHRNNNETGRVVDRQRCEVRHDCQTHFASRSQARNERRRGSAARPTRERDHHSSSGSCGD
ncbi:MAG: hypothetical protein HYV60_21800 [Planctomycetia bacterium]|nr:hypothetical protein [Planctomycetia bacterium]